MHRRLLWWSPPTHRACSAVGVARSESCSVCPHATPLCRMYDAVAYCCRDRVAPLHARGACGEHQSPIHAVLRHAPTAQPAGAAGSIGRWIGLGVLAGRLSVWISTPMVQVATSHTRVCAPHAPPTGLGAPGASAGRRGKWNYSAWLTVRPRPLALRHRRRLQ